MIRFCLQLYKQVFYRLYLWDKKISPFSRMHEWNAILTLSVYSFFNICSILAIVQLISGYKVIEILAVTHRPVYAVVTTIVVYMANFAVLRWIGIKNIIKELGGEQPDHSKLNKTLVSCYEVGTVLLFFGSFILVAVRDY